MPRFLLENGVYHTVSATRGRSPIFMEPRCASAVLEAIDRSRQDGKVLVLAYALLPDHLHLLSVPLGGLTVSDVMKAIKGASAKTINKLQLHRGPIWQQSFYDRVIRDEEHLTATTEYILHNPVVAGLAENPAQYRYCSAYPSATTDAEEFFGGPLPENR